MLLIVAYLIVPFLTYECSLEIYIFIFINHYSYLYLNQTQIVEFLPNCLLAKRPAIIIPYNLRVQTINCSINLWASKIQHA